MPSPRPAPRRVRLTLDFTVEEFAEYERMEACVRGKMRKRSRRELVILEMGRLAMSGTAPATRLRYQIVVHTDSRLENAWCETERGVLPVDAHQLERELADAHVTVLGEPPDVPGGKTTDGSHDVRRSTIRLLLARSGGRCEVCRRSGPLHVHHKNPRSRGGGHDLENVELRCDACHHFVHAEDYRTDPHWRTARQRRRARASSQKARDG